MYTTMCVVSLSACVSISDESDVKIKNSQLSNTNIKDIYIKLSSNTYWGKDRLVNGELKPNQYKKFTLTRCTKKYDYKVVYLDDTVNILRNHKVKCRRTSMLIFKDH